LEKCLGFFDFGTLDEQVWPEMQEDNNSWWTAARNEQLDEADKEKAERIYKIIRRIANRPLKEDKELILLFEDLFWPFDFDST